MLYNISMNTNKELNYRLYLQREEAFIRTNVQSEFSRYHDIKNGDIEKVKENIAYIQSNFFNGKGTLSEDPLKNCLYHFIVSAGIIARVCIDAGLSHDESYTLSDIYIQKADRCKTPSAIVSLLCDMHLDYATRMHNLKKNLAISPHIRRAIDYIYDHLNEALTLAALASYVNLDPSYFSKLFFKETGCTTKKYILSAKITTAQNMLLYSNYSISSIALSLGFSSQSAFQTAFRRITGQTPRMYRKEHTYTSLLP